MITLQTGVPGTGKTASVVHLLMTDDSYTHFTDKDGVKKQRPLYVYGINEFKLPHNPLTIDQIQAQPLQDFLPYGSLVVIDEVQDIMPSRTPGSKVPDFIQALAKHRHHGLDIILITQHPQLLDPFVRKLVQRHLHIMIKPIGRVLYEWTNCQDSPDKEPAISKAVQRNFTVPKDTFDQYKSAEIHTKPKRRLPRSMYFLILFLPVLIGFGIKTYIGISDRITEETAIAQQTDLPNTNPVHQHLRNDGHQVGQSLTPQMYAPTIPEKPESKPIYDNVRQVQTFERIAACIQGGQSGCTCYSDQATKLKEVSVDDCLKYVRDGLPFNPFREPERVHQQQPATQDG